MMQALTASEARQIRNLHQRKERQRERLFIVEGEKGVAEALAAGWGFHALILTDRFLRAHPSYASELPIHLQPLCRLAGEKIMASISTVVTPPDILAVLKMPESSLESLMEADFLVLLDGIADPGNLGTIIRTSDWFGIKAVLLGPGCVDVYNDKTVRSAMGSLFHVQALQLDDLRSTVAQLKESGFSIHLADVMGGSPAESRPSKICLVMGSESHGIGPELHELADGVYSIPAKGGAESLNVAISYAILAYELTKEHVHIS